MLYLQGKILFVSTVRLKTVENMEVEINYLKWDVSNLALKCCKSKNGMTSNFLITTCWRRDGKVMITEV